MAKILIHGHLPFAPTGNGRVVSVLADCLHRAGHDVIVVGVGEFIGPKPATPYRLVEAHPAATNLGQDTVIHLLRKERPDLLLTTGDPWMSEKLVQCREIQTVVWMAYLTLDGDPMPAAFKDWAMAVDYLVTCSDFGSRTLLAATGRNAPCMRHGIDTILFRRHDKAKAKQRLGVGDRFVVGTVAVNQQRKNLPVLIQGFAQFVSEEHLKDKAALYLHTGHEGTWDIEDLLVRNQIQDITWMPQEPMVTDWDLVQTYNAMDLFVLPTMGEGFGLPILEASACGVVAMATDCSACPEVMFDRDIQAMSPAFVTPMGRGVSQAFVSSQTVADAIFQQYKADEEVKAARSREAVLFAHNFDWFFLLPKLIHFVDEALKIRPFKSVYAHPRFHQI